MIIESIKILQRKVILVIRLFFIKTIRIIEPPKNKTDNKPALKKLPWLFLKSNAVIINRRENKGKTQAGRVPKDNERNWFIIVSASINPPTIKNNSPNKSLKLLLFFLIIE